MTNFDSILKSRDITLLTKVCLVKAMVFSSSLVQVWGLDHKEGWAKNWCFWIVVLEKSPLDSKEIKPVNPKGNQPWIFIGRTDAEAEAPILRPPDANSQLIRKDPDTRKDWGQKKGAAVEEMVSQHHKLHGHESEQTLEDSGAWHATCSPWGLREPDTTLRLNNNDKLWEKMCANEATNKRLISKIYSSCSSIENKTKHQILSSYRAVWPRESQFPALSLSSLICELWGLNWVMPKVPSTWKVWGLGEKIKCLLLC